ncbi:hypothetical protein [Haladaptatus sp. NG-WS-4]
MSGRTEGGLVALLRPVADLSETVGDRTPVSSEVAAGLLAFVAAGSMSAIRVGRNGPVSMPAVVSDLSGAIATLSLLGPAVAAFVLAVAADRELERAGFLFVAVFGTLAALTPAVAVPALVAIVGGGTLAVGSRLGRPRGYRAIRHWAVVSGVLLAAVFSLGSAMGVLSVGLRSTGSTLALLGIACTPVFVRPRWPEWAVGGVVAGLVLKAGLDAPFVTGAATLVGLAAVGTSLPVIVAGVGGGTVTALSGLRSERTTRGIGAGLLLVAGVPATIPRTIAVVLGLALLVSPAGGDAT